MPYDILTQFMDRTLKIEVICPVSPQIYNEFYHWNVARPTHFSLGEDRGRGHAFAGYVYWKPTVRFKTVSFYTQLNDQVLHRTLSGHLFLLFAFPGWVPTQERGRGYNEGLPIVMSLSERGGAMGDGIFTIVFQGECRLESHAPFNAEWGARMEQAEVIQVLGRRVSSSSRRGPRRDWSPVDSPSEPRRPGSDRDI